MYNRLLRLYLEGRLTEVGLDNAVLKMLILPEEKVLIMEQKPIEELDE